MYALEFPIHLLIAGIAAINAFLAIRLIALTGKTGAWLLSAVAILLLAADRIQKQYIHFTGWAATFHAISSDVTFLVAVAFQLAGVVFIRVLFVEHKEAQAELGKQLDELRRFQKVAVGRELRLKELSDELAALRPQPGGGVEAVAHSSLDNAMQNERSAMLFMLEDLERARKQIEEVHLEWVRALDAIDDPIFLHDRDFRVLRANRAYQRLAGLTFKELIGRPYYEIFPKMDAPLPCCQQAMENAEEEILCGDRIYRSVAAAVRNEQEGYQFSIHILEDVTEFRKQQAALRESESRLRAIMDNSESLIYLVDSNGKFLALNKKLAELFHLPKEQIIGKTREAILPPEIAQQHRENDLQVIRHKLPVMLEETNPQEDGTHTYLTLKAPVVDDNGVVCAIAGSSTDITERKRREVAIQRSNRALRTISAGNQTLIHAAEEAGLLRDMCNVAVQFGGYRMAWIGYARDDADKTIEQMAQAGFEKSGLNLPPLTWDSTRQQSSPAGEAIISGKTIVVQDILSGSGVNPWREHAQQCGYASSIALPLLDGERAFGVLMLFDEKVDVFDGDEVKLLEEMAGDLAFGIITLRLREAHREHEQRLQKNMLQTVEAIAGIVEMRDPYTSGHQVRVAELAREIARQMGLTVDEQQAIHLAGLVHDLGKVSIPAEILSKPGRLNEIEYGLIKMHPQAGYDILKGVDFPWPIAQMVWQHHERLDGSGYPLGLQGDEILLGARILSVADIVEAMSSHRPYRPGLGMEAALEEIERGRGTHYDAQAADACIALFKEHGYVFHK